MGDTIAALEPALPTGISVVALEEVPLKDPALPSTISCAVYQVALAGMDQDEVERRVADLMDRDTFQVEFRRRTYDIRSLIGSLTLRGEGDRTVLEMTLLRNQRGRIGRPDVVLEALGLSAYARRVHRVRIIFGAGPA
jgi:hypothetical protein